MQYREQMCHSEVGFTKYIYMTLVNAYAKFGNFEMAKQVIFVCAYTSLVTIEAIFAPFTSYVQYFVGLIITFVIYFLGANYQNLRIKCNLLTVVSREDNLEGIPINIS